MGSDLFGSYAESSCAALFVASISSFGVSHDYTAMSYPLIISSMGIVICLITTLFATDFTEIQHVSEIEPSLKRQLLISTVLMTAGIAVVSFFALPSEFTLFNFGAEKAVKNWYVRKRSLLSDSLSRFPLFSTTQNNFYANRSCTGTSSSALRSACGQDLLSAIPRSTIQVMLTGKCISLNTFTAERLAFSSPVSS